MLNKVRPIVKMLLEKEGYIYVEEGYWKVLRDCLRMYEKYFSGAETIRRCT